MGDDHKNMQLIGYSAKVDDTGLTDKQDRDSRNLYISAFLAPLILIAAFQIAAFFYSDFSRLAWLIIGAVTGVIVMIILLIQSANRKRVSDFEGELVKKIVRRKSSGDPASGMSETYYVHTLIFRGADRKKHKHSGKYIAKKPPENSWPWYLQIGDQVRYHSKPDYFEKYDKSQDSLLPCAECRCFFDIGLDNCPSCGVPAIKP